MRPLALAALVLLAGARIGPAQDAPKPPPEASKPPQEAEPETELESDRVPKTKTKGNVLLRDATVHTVAKAGTLARASIFVRNGRIAQVAETLSPPEGVTVIECRGLHVTPGIVDCHSHMAIEGGVNEGTLAITAECRIGDVLDPEDVTIFRALAGGVTAANVLHGSANPIGGQNAVVRMRTKAAPSEMLFPGAPPGIKFALGENPKRAGGRGEGARFPGSRMGVEASIRRAFVEAREYQAALRKYRDARAEGESAPEPRRDLRLEALVEVLEGRRLVHCHCYRADEILMMMRVAEEFGFRVSTFQHVLEGYKVAPEMAAHGAGGSTFSDWWAFKMEALDAIPYNAALMQRAGVLVSLNSDSGELVRRLNLEAAKAMKYGGLSRDEALALVTKNPALQLGIGKRVGTIEPGKDADLAVWNGDPLSVYSRCVATLVLGEVAFEKPGEPLPAVSLAAPTPDLRPAPPPGAGPFALVGATVHPVSGPPIPGATLRIDAGKIAAVGPDVRPAAGDEVVDVSGLQVYPGLLDAGCSVGLRDVGSVPATHDLVDPGNFQPDLRAAIAFHVDSDVVPVTRANGITSVVARPQGGAISGQSALMRLAGWTREEMAVKDPLALHVRVPTQARRAPGSRRPTGDEAKAESERASGVTERRRELREIFRRAADRARMRAAGAALEPDPSLDALEPYATGRGLVVLEAETVEEIRAAAEFAGEAKLRAAIAGGSEAWKVTNLLREKGLPVIVGPVLSLPRRSYDPYDAVYANAGKLHRAGIRFCFRSDDASNARNLGMHAGMAAAFGLPREEALRAVTLSPAEILGVADRLGSLEPGKDADLIVTDGDPLEPSTHVLRMWSAGRPADLRSKHTDLYEKYRRRPAPPKPAARPSAKGPGKPDGESPGRPPGGAPENSNQASPSGDLPRRKLSEILRPIREKHDIPAMAAALVGPEKVLAVCADGVRRRGAEQKVTVEDRFHLGSCTKAMTATLLARLVEEGKLSWDAKPAETFQDLGGIHAGWSGVTLMHLLTHRGGAPENLDADGLWGKLWTHAGTPTEQRLALVEGVLRRAPVAEPGAKYLYSNAGYAIAGAVAERREGKGWEALMRERLFEPLGMKSAGFGAPGKPGTLDQPRGHTAAGKPVEPGPGSDNPAAIGPAGTAHATIGDWGKFISLHLRAGRGKPALLRPESFARLHAPPAMADGADYAAGWIVTTRPWTKGPVLTHAGSNTMWYAVAWLAPESGFAVLVAANQGGDAAAKACDEAAAAVIRDHLGRK